MSEKMFVPFSEELLAAAGSPLGELVPFQLGYRCVRLLDGTYDFSGNFNPPENPQSDTQSQQPCPQSGLQKAFGIVQAA